MKIRVVKLEGIGITFTDIAIRNLLRAADGLFFYFVAGVSMFCTNRIQRLGDLAAGTIVVSEENQASIGSSPLLQHDPSAAPEVNPVLGLSKEHVNVISNYLMRRHELTIEYRLALLPKLIQGLQQKSVSIPVEVLQELAGPVDMENVDHKEQLLNNLIHG